MNSPVAASAARERQEALAELTLVQNRVADLIDDLGEARKLLNPSDDEANRGFYEQRIAAAKGMIDRNLVTMPDGERIPSLNGAVGAGRLLLGSRSWSTPLKFETIEGFRWYVHAKYRWTTHPGDDGVRFEFVDIDHPHQDLIDRLDALEKALWTKPGVKGIPSRDHALSAIGEVRGAVSSTYDAPSESVKTRIGAAVARAADLLARGREMIGSIRQAAGDK